MFPSCMSMMAPDESRRGSTLEMFTTPAPAPAAQHTRAQLASAASSRNSTAAGIESATKPQKTRNS
jgi:hypothetical protein